MTRAGSQGSLLVVDRCSGSVGEELLLAHLPSDEPFENAVLVCQHYLDEHPTRRGCRPVTAEDRLNLPLQADSHSPRLEATDPEVVARRVTYRLERGEGAAISQLRWRRWAIGAGSPVREAVSLRAAIGEVESYEPFCAISRAALAFYRDDPKVSTTILRAELERVLESSIVLNRGLRKAVLERLKHEGLSMSEIAIRCGRVKRDCNGNESGETSWLARRLGLLPEGGKDRPTPWVHSDVLALIAREGIGVSPREVELG
jgi:hypothetical protein